MRDKKGRFKAGNAGGPGRPTRLRRILKGLKIGGSVRITAKRKRGQK